MKAIIILAVSTMLLFNNAMALSLSWPTAEVTSAGNKSVNVNITGNVDQNILGQNYCLDEAVNRQLCISWVLFAVFDDGERVELKTGGCGEVLTAASCARKASGGSFPIKFTSWKTACAFVIVKNYFYDDRPDNPVIFGTGPSPSCTEISHNNNSCELVEPSITLEHGTIYVNSGMSVAKTDFTISCLESTNLRVVLTPDVVNVGRGMQAVLRATGTNDGQLIANQGQTTLSLTSEIDTNTATPGPVSGQAVISLEYL